MKKSEISRKNNEKSEKTKILAIGDIHGDTGLVKRLADMAKKENVNIVILAGDLTMAEESTKYIIGPFLSAGNQVLLIPGNHESIATADFLAESYERTKNIHGSGLKKGDLGIFGAGTANMGVHQIPDSDIFKALKKGYSEIENAKRKIMVTHVHPYGSKAEIFGFKGSKAVRRAIEQFNPDILISAHIHEAGGLQETIGKTRVFNVSRKERIFEI